MPRHGDPAERSGYLRYFYRAWRPTFVGRLWSRSYAWVAGLGILPVSLISLQTSNRRTGQVNSTILVAATYQGHRYLVSMLGDNSEWVQNVRASGGAATIKRGGLRRVQLTEIPVHERAPFLKAWAMEATSGRKHLPVSHDAPVSDFEAIAPDYPVFRIDPLGHSEPRDDA